jgi:hypothetical protein
MLHTNEKAFDLGRRTLEISSTLNISSTLEISALEVTYVVRSTYEITLQSKSID